MILLGLSITAAISLLALIVWALLRNQRRKNVENADRNLPLPPLRLNEIDAPKTPNQEHTLGNSTPTPSRRAIAPSQQAAVPQRAIAATEQWLVSCREKLARGEFAEALQHCHSALPQMRAFRQSCVVLRAEIRQLKKKGQSHSDALERLYRLAALADFFHGRTPNTKPFPSSAIKRIDYAAWEALRSPYAVLGYEHVSLLSKTDVKWLVQAWGEPETHRYMRELHIAQWNDLHGSVT